MLTGLWQISSSISHGLVTALAALQTTGARLTWTLDRSVVCEYLVYIQTWPAGLTVAARSRGLLSYTRSSFATGLSCTKLTRAHVTAPLGLRSPKLRG